MEFVWIQPGTFVMGSPDSEPGHDSDEGPQHEVTISRGFWLGKYEITQRQWESVMGTTPWSGQEFVRSNPNHPAVYVTWEDVQEFIRRLNGAAGESVYRLPSEAEWEYACRAGTMSWWSFGDDEGQLRDHAWYGANVQRPRPHEVGTRAPNPWGLYDMHGSVAEWVHDWYDESYYRHSPSIDPLGPVTFRYRVRRGGSFHGKSQDTRSASRSIGSPDEGYNFAGARLLRTE